MESNILPIQKTFRKLGSRDYAEKVKRFFKTDKGDYADKDLFLGIRSPDIRKIAKENTLLSITNTKKLIKSKYHEERLLGLIILVNKYKKSKEEKEKIKIYELYISHFKYINNWDLVDVTCPHIVGKYLMNRDRSILYEWAKSEHLWTKRIAIISNWWFIRKGDLRDVFSLSSILLEDKHDLIHKAVGWMLREAGKKDVEKLEKFLKFNLPRMSRTTLRYAIEKLSKDKRQRYLKL